jgi:hypothetical protein
VGRQPEIDAVPDAGEFGVVIDFLGVERDAGQEAEGLAEILELEGAEQRLFAVLQRPAIGCVHCDSPVLQSPR